MKVLVFTSLYPNNVWPNHGVFVKERMARFAQLNGGTVRVVAPVPYFPSIGLGWRRAFSRVARQEVRDGLEIYHPRYVMTPKVGMALYGLMMFLSVWRTVAAIRRTYDFDVIDAHYVFPDGFAAILLGRVFKRPVVVSARGSDINQFASFRLIRPLLRFTLLNADGVIAVCQALKDAMVELGIPAGKISVVSNGVDPRKFYPVEKTSARRELGLPQGKMVLSVGGLIPRKGFDLVIRAMKAVIDGYGEKEAWLAIVGEGPSRNDLLGLVASLGLSERIRLVGAVPHHDLVTWYSAADVSCLASSREGWPNVILESLACGTPVVAANIWGIPEIIRSDRVGLLVNRSADEIAAVLVRALTRTWDRASLVQFAKGQTWDSAAGSLRRVFEGVLERRHGR
jgi:glycosyltransferase involved in cell wall biosynthesis